MPEVRPSRQGLENREHVVRGSLRQRDVPHNPRRGERGHSPPAGLFWLHNGATIRREAEEEGSGR
jgi:hypothetical protein